MIRLGPVGGRGDAFGITKRPQESLEKGSLRTADGLAPEFCLTPQHLRGDPDFIVGKIEICKRKY